MPRHHLTIQALNMRIHLMRRIDYWLGVPSCFLVSLLCRIVKPFRRPTSSVQPRKILFIELSEMGSAVLAYPALERAKKLFPAVERYFLIFKRNKESCEILGIIPSDKVLVIDDRSFPRFFVSTILVLLKIRKLKIDTAVDLELFSRCTALLTILSGARTRVGFCRGTSEGLYRGNFLTHPVIYNPHTHIALNFLALVEALVSDTSKTPIVKADLSQHLIPLPQISNTEEERDTIEGRLRGAIKGDESPRFVVVNPDPGDALPLRGWPIDKFISVARKILEDDPATIIVVMGLKRSKSYAQAFIEGLGSERCIDFTNQTANLREVLALFRASKLLITNDSGPAHMAALTPVHSIVLYGPETPALYGPLSKRAVSLFANYSCSPCLSAMNHRESLCTDNLCMRAISVDEVFSYAKRMLNRGSSLVVYNPRAA